MWPSPLLLIVSAGQKCMPKFKSRKIWRYAHGDFDHACELLDSTDWNSLFSSGDINTCWSSWKARFLEVMQLCIPQTTLRTRRNLPWLTKQVIHAIRKRDAIFRRSKKCRSPVTYQKYRAARNKVTALIRLNKKKFSNHQLIIGHEVMTSYVLPTPNFIQESIVIQISVLYSIVAQPHRQYRPS